MVMSAGADLARLGRVLAPYRKTYFVAYLAALAAAGCHLVLPWLIGRGLMAALHRDWSRLDHLMIAFAATVALLVAASLVDQVQRQSATRALVHDLQSQLFERVQRLSLLQLERWPPGDIISRVQRDVGALQEAADTSTGVLTDVVFFVGAVVLMARLDPMLALLMLTILAGYLVLRALSATGMAALYRRAGDTAAALDVMLAENITGLGVVQAARRERVNAVTFQAAVRRNARAQSLAGWATGAQIGLAELVAGLCTGAALLVAALAVIQRPDGLGSLIALLLYAQRLVEPVLSLNIQFNLAQRAAAAAHRVSALLDAPQPESRVAHVPAPHPDAPALAFSDVTFSYEVGKPVLRQVSFSVAPGETIAIVGPTGSGKSTLAALAAGLFDAASGVVSIAGQDIGALAPAERARMIVMVPQEPFLFSGTIAENIAYGVPAPQAETLRAAAMAAGADEFIQRLPDGYATLLVSGGGNLSAGQRQLIGLARAFLRRPAVLILDESTGLLDGETEAQVRSGLCRLMAGRTCLVIAHRMATVRGADQIVVLRDGRVIERGRHENLLAANGAYAAFVTAPGTL